LDHVHRIEEPDQENDYRDCHHRGQHVHRFSPSQHLQFGSAAAAHPSGGRPTTVIRFAPGSAPSRPIPRAASTRSLFSRARACPAECSRHLPPPLATIPHGSAPYPACRLPRSPASLRLLRRLALLCRPPASIGRIAAPAASE